MSDNTSPQVNTNNATEVVQRQLEAYNARDLEVFLSTYAPTITIARHSDGKVILDGLESLRSSYGSLFANSPKLHCEVLSRIVLGNYVIDHEHVTGRGSAPPLTAVVIYEVQNELIQRAWMLRG